MWACVRGARAHARVCKPAVEVTSPPHTHPPAGPWHPVIRRSANQAFLRHHVFEGGLDSSVAQARAKFGARGQVLSNAKV